MWKKSLVLVLFAFAFCAWAALATPDTSRSSNIALLDGGEKLIQINRLNDSVSLFRVRTGNQDAFLKIGEVAVGQDPRYLCIRPGDSEAWVTNSASGTISRVNLRGRPRVSGEFYVGAEPRGCAFTPNGKLLLVVLRGEGRVVVIEPESGNSVLEASVGGQPEAIAITNDGDLDDLEEWAFVTQFFAQPIPGGPGEGFDDGKQGVVHAFPVATCKVTNVPLAPALSGFSADRTAFCSQFNENAHSDIFCPDTTITDPDSTVITQDPQYAFPNQLHNLIIRQGEVYALSTAAQPEPPVIFNNNVQSFVSVVNIDGLSENRARLTKLNDQIKTEAQPADPTTSLDRLFANDVVAIEANRNGQEFLLVSRGGNYVIRARSNAAGLDIGAPDDVVRLPTGNIPTGIVANSAFSRAYVNNEISGTFSVFDLNTNTVIDEVPATTVPAPGTPKHRAILGELAFLTALGLGNDDLLSTSVRDLNLFAERNKASDNAWSSCSSCHPDGLSDSVTWMFPTGPRQSVPMDSSWGNTPGDQRIFNWSGVRGSVRDFNNNARNIQGGEGFADDPGSIFNHGLTHDLSDALDLMTFWLQSKLRTPNRPSLADANQLTLGRETFVAACASCHGGDKFTKSSIAHRHNPTFDANPLAGGQALDDAITNAGPQILQIDLAGQQLTFLEDVGTFNAENPLEIRGAGAAGITALGGLGFNVPSLLGVGATAPYFHNGSAQTLEEVFAQHLLRDGNSIQQTLSTEEAAALLAFLNQLDGRTSPVASEAEAYRKALIGQ